MDLITVLFNTQWILVVLLVAIGFYISALKNQEKNEKIDNSQKIINLTIVYYGTIMLIGILFVPIILYKVF